MITIINQDEDDGATMMVLEEVDENNNRGGREGPQLQVIKSLFGSR